MKHTITLEELVKRQQEHFNQMMNRYNRSSVFWYDGTNTTTYWANSNNNYQTFFVNLPSKEEPKLRQIEDEEEYRDLFE